jgi:hypothetical protein
VTINYFCIRMKNIHYPVLLFAAFILVSCGEEKKNSPTEQKTEIVDELPTGTIIAADSMRVRGDELNIFVFSVKISTTAKTHKGKYLVDAAWGFNNGSREIVMPKNDYPLIPVLKRTGEPYSYIIGFYIKDDTTFYDYYAVKGDHGDISMGYTKGYRFK